MPSREPDVATGSRSHLGEILRLAADGVAVSRQSPSVGSCPATLKRGTSRSSTQAPLGVCWAIRGTLISAACAGFAGR
jgi:hypothetical protein